MKFIIFILSFICFLPSQAQDISGCIDSLALNYNIEAVTSDGSCIYVNHTPEIPWDFQTGEYSHIVIFPENANILINETPISVGDFIGVFHIEDGQEYCAGYTYWTGENTSLSIWGSSDGGNMPVGTSFEFKIWDSENAVAYPALANYTISGPYTDGEFTPNGFSQINTLTANSVTNLSLDQIISPVNSCGMGLSQVTFQITNSGNSDVYHIDLGLVVNDSSWTFSEPISLPSGSSRSVSISELVDFSPWNDIDIELSILSSFNSTSDLNSVSTSIFNDPQLEISVLKSDVLCPGDSNGALEIFVSGGEGEYNIDWQNDLVGFNPENLSAGNYEFTVNDEGLCSKTTEISLTDPEPISYQVNIGEIFCYNGVTDVSVDISGGTGLTQVNWLDSNPLEMSSGEYNFEISDQNNCTADLVFTLNQPEELSVIHPSIEVPCIGLTTNADITIQGGVGGYSIDWQGADSTSLVSGTHEIIVSDSNECEVSYDLVIGQPSPIQIDLNLIQPLCNNEIGKIDPVISGGYAPYEISFDYNMDSLVEANYIISVTDSNGCIANNVFSIDPSQSDLTDCYGLTFEQSNFQLETTPSFDTIYFEIPIYSALSQEVIVSTDVEDIQWTTPSVDFSEPGNQMISGFIYLQEAKELSGSIEAYGADWGFAKINFEASIIQNEISASTNSIDFYGNTLLNSDTVSLIISNLGNNDLQITEIISSEDFITTQWYNNPISGGDDMEIQVIYTPINAGYFTSTLTINSNDPLQPSIEISCQGNAVSEVYGIQTGVWSAINSPYSVVGDVVVPDGESLIIEPGVEVIFENDYYISVYGTFQANGTEQDSIIFKSVDTIPHGAFEFFETDNPVVMDYCVIDGLNQFNGYDYPSHEAMISIGDHTSQYNSRFESENTQGWTSDGYSVFVTDGYYSNEYWAGCCWRSSYTYSPEVNISPNETVSFNFEYYNNWWNSCDGDLYFQYRFFDGSNWSGWNQFSEYDNCEITDWTIRNFDVDPGNSSKIQFRFYNYFYYGMRFRLKNFEILQESNDYLFIRDSDKESSVLNLHTSDIHMTNSHIKNCKKRFSNVNTNLYEGDEGIFSVDSAQVQISNCHFENNSSYALKTNAVDLEIENSLIDSLGIYMDVNQNELSILNSQFSNITNDGFDIYGNGLEIEIENSQFTNIDNRALNFSGSNINLNLLETHFTSTQGIRLNSDTSSTNVQSCHFNDQTNDALNISGSQATLTVNESEIMGGSNEGIDISAYNSNVLLSNSTFDSNHRAYYSDNNNIVMQADSILVSANEYGFRSQGINSTSTIFDSQFIGNTGNAIESNSQYSHVNLEKVIIKENNSNAIYMSGDAYAILNNCVIHDNNGVGLRTSGHQIVNYSTLFNNSGRGLEGYSSIELKNSIIYGNNANALMQIYCSSNLDAQYSSIQGVYSYGINSNPNDETLNNVITADPMLDENGYLMEGSPAIDAGMPWEHDRIMPPGLEGVTADMGAYGGPNNQVWGDGTLQATEVPDGAPVIMEIIDIPQDQGGFVGLQFQASVFDFGLAGYEIEYYSIWRNLQLDPNGEDFWEKIGEIPAQSFQFYGFTAETLGDSIMDNPIISEFSIIAHTNFEEVYWMSEIGSGYSTDNIAPLMPEGIEGRYAFDGDLSINWNDALEEDYVASEIYRDGVLIGTTTDTHYVDESAQPNHIYNYHVHHLDLSGNVSDAGVIDVSSMLPTWIPETSEITHHIAIPEESTITTTNDEVERGDFLGVFYDRNGVLECGGMIQWSDEDVVLTTYGNSEQILGFRSFELFTWKFWDASKNEYYDVEVTYSSELPNQNFFIEDGLSAIESIQIFASQEIDLKNGWSMVSAYVLENDLWLSSLFAPVREDIVIMKDHLGSVYWPSYVYNELGDFSDEKGYKLLMNRDRNISFTGKKVIPNEKILNLEEGWQIIPYLRENPASTEHVFEPIRESIIIVKNDMGQVFWPQWNVNTIGNMIPGKAYQIKLNQNIDFSYSANGIEVPLDQRLGNVQPKFFLVDYITESNMTIGIPLESWSTKPNYMDEIAVCDMHDRIVGSGVFLDEDLVITVWENDEYTLDKKGLNLGEKFKLKIRDIQSQTNYSLNINSWTTGDGYYDKDEISIVGNLEYGEIIDRDFYVYPVIPNPVKTKINLQVYSPNYENVKVQIFNVLGALSYENSIDINEGIHNLSIPTKKLSSGTYQIKVQNSNSVDVQLIQIID